MFEAQENDFINEIVNIIKKQINSKVDYKGFICGKMIAKTFSNGEVLIGKEVIN